MVIDDLADRQHDCDILLDQTYGRNAKDYQSLVPNSCLLLCGSEYALLRKEFAQWREYSLKRRSKGELKHLLINLGGVDKDNLTTQILKELSKSDLPRNCIITVVMGATSPWIDTVQQQATVMPWPTTVKVGVSNMAELMANSDLAIGAAGSTTWERCCLGLPSIVIFMAENQRKVIHNLKKSKSAVLCSVEESTRPKSIQYKLTLIKKELTQMIENSSTIVDGLGSIKVIKLMGCL